MRESRKDVAECDRNTVSATRGGENGRRWSEHVGPFQPLAQNTSGPRVARAAGARCDGNGLKLELRSKCSRDGGLRGRGRGKSRAGEWEMGNGR